jgi:hypothetical protein
MLSRAVDNFMEHYHTERNHQGLGNVVPMSMLGKGYGR